MFPSGPRRPGQRHSLSVARFDPGRGEWVETPGEPPRETAGSRVERLVLATFNVWFGDLNWQRRQDALLDELERVSPDVVGLQEVQPRFLRRLLEVDWVRRDYALSDVWDSTLGAYGVLLLSRLPVREFSLLDLPSQMGRRLLMADLELDGELLRVGSVHLESTAGQGLARGVQLEKIFPVLDEADSAVLMGDLNFDPSSEYEQGFLLESYQDAWSALHPDLPGWTEDTERNLLRQDKKSVEKQVRFDRILLRSERWRPVTMERLGLEPVGHDLPRVFPSDHFGLTSTLELAPLPTARHGLTILAVTDVSRVAEFYRRAFGWPSPVEVPVYVQFDLPDGNQLGIYQREAYATNTGGLVPAPVPPGAITGTELYFRVPDLGPAIDKLRAAGARELAPRARKPWGEEAAYFADPEGNVVVVAQGVP